MPDTAINLPTQLLAVLVFAALGGISVLLWARMGRGRKAGERAERQERGTFTMVCSVCHKSLVIPLNGLEPLSPVEMALTVREHPEVVGKKLSEYICPHCDASHCFVMQGKKATWLGANFYEPQYQTSNCLECTTTLAAPPWPKGQYDGKLRAAPQLAANFGLTCPHCGATCCVACCSRITHNRTPDGSFLCPRCSRGPVEQFFHP